MTHVLIYTFFGTALAVGLYCFWVSLRVEFARVPRFLHFNGGEAYHPALNGTGTNAISGNTAQHLR